MFNQDQFNIDLKDVFEELILSQIDVINSPECTETDKMMLPVLYQLFEDTLNDEDKLKELKNISLTYNEVIKRVKEQN